MKSRFSILRLSWNRAMKFELLGNVVEIVKKNVAVDVAAAVVELPDARWKEECRGHDHNCSCSSSCRDELKHLQYPSLRGSSFCYSSLTHADKTEVAAASEESEPTAAGFLFLYQILRLLSRPYAMFYQPSSPSLVDAESEPAAASFPFLYQVLRLLSLPFSMSFRPSSSSAVTKQAVDAHKIDHT
ncbi:hypothetical protein AAC387_Pa01g2723 [Persea americana]